MRLLLEAVSFWFLFSVYINLGSKKIIEILRGFLDSNDLSFLPVAGLIESDYVQIRKSSKDVQMLNHYSAP